MPNAESTLSTTFKWIMGIFSSLIIIAVSIILSTLMNHSESIRSNKTEVAVINSEYKNVKEDVREIKGDVKELLRRKRNKKNE